MTKTSYITGEALAMFGGAINFEIGYNPDKKIVGIGLSKLKKQLEIGETLTGDEERYEPQIELIFGSVESINIFRRALDIAERTLKDGAIPQPEGGEE